MACWLGILWFGVGAETRLVKGKTPRNRARAPIEHPPDRFPWVQRMHLQLCRAGSGVQSGTAEAGVPELPGVAQTTYAPTTNA